MEIVQVNTKETRITNFNPADDTMQIHITTYSPGSGRLVTSVKTNYVKDEGGYETVSHTFFEDFCTIVKEEKVKRATESKLVEQHAKMVDVNYLSEYLKMVNKHYNLS